MQHSPRVSNPFEMMLNPEAVVQAMENSPKLNGLRSRICRPLDNPNKRGEDIESVEPPESVTRGTQDH